MKSQGEQILLGVERASKAAISIPTQREFYTVIDLFSGCGGMSLGFKQAGFEVVLAVDIDSNANQEYECNLGSISHQIDLFEVSSDQILNLAWIKKGELDVLVGCPPCQGFTQLRSRNKSYQTNDLVGRMAKLVVEINPRFVVFENVPGLLHQGIDHFDEYLSILAKAGYHTVYDKLQAADYGVPQLRKRVIALSTRIDSLKSKLSLPRATYCNPKKVDRLKLKPWRTVRDAISHLPPVTSGMTHSSVHNHQSVDHSKDVLEIIRHVPHDGGSRKAIPKHLWLDCHKKLDKGAENIYGRMSWDSPSPTISSRCNTPACGRFIHPEQDRGITIREALLLQSFPMYYRLTASPSVATQLVGNAMPVRFAKRIAQHIAGYLQKLK